jgi:hypothetical protein
MSASPGTNITRAYGLSATVQAAALCEIKRLLKAHRFDFGLPAGDKRVALDLIEAVIPVEQRHIGVATVRSGDAQLPAVDLANATRNVEFDPAGIMRNWPSARSSPQPPAATLFDVRKFR